MRNILNKKVLIVVSILIIICGVFIFYNLKPKESHKNKPVAKKIFTNGLDCTNRNPAPGFTKYQKARNTIKDCSLYINMCQDGTATSCFKEDLKNIKPCYKLLKDFVTNNDIEFIKPIINTDNYKDKKLQAFLNKCPELNKDFSFTAALPVPGSYTNYNFKEEEKRYLNILKEMRKKGYPLDEMRKSLTIFEPAYGFEVYDIDFDNNPNNGKQILFRAAYFIGHENIYTLEIPDYNEEYRVVDMNKCKSTASCDVNAEQYINKRDYIGSYSGVIRYKDKYYIYEVGFMYLSNNIDTKKEKAADFISFYKWNNEHGTMFFCNLDYNAYKNEDEE